MVDHHTSYPYVKAKRGRESKHPHPKGCYIMLLFESMRAERERERINTHLRDVISCSLFESMHIWLFIRGIGISFSTQSKKGRRELFYKKDSDYKYL